MLVALSLMPFSMTSASAAAAPLLASEHCADHQKPTDAPAAPNPHCAACAALPAVETPAAVEDLRPTLQLTDRAEQWLTEQEPETDTPPPKNG